MKTLAFFYHLLRTSMRSSITKRGAFIIECALMIGNNLIFIAIWWIFFRQFNDIAGWQFTDMMLLMAIGTGGYGIMKICFGGVKNISKMIVSGDLDPFMTQPKNLLLHIAGSKSISNGWGLLMYSAGLIALAGITDPLTLALIFVGIICSAIVFTSVNITAYCLPFWFGSIDRLSKKYCDSFFLFALYPTNIYSGLMQIVMFTLIPAGIISYLPVELVRHFSWEDLFILTGSSLFLMGLACFVFYSGLRRYESGNAFGTRL